MKNQLIIFSLFIMTLVNTSVHSASFNVTLINTTHGNYFTPLLISAHNSVTHLFQLGQQASPELQAMAEGGDITGLVRLLGGVDADTVADPVAGLLGPGETTSTELDTNSSGHTRLSIVAMILPSNDAFVGLEALDIPTQAGQYTYYLNAYDAGSEINNELVNLATGGIPGQLGVPGVPGTTPGLHGTGVTTTELNQSVHIHRGILGDLDPIGGPSDLDRSLHRWLNPVAQLVITVR